MFGPDRCGYDVSRIHAIFTHGGKNLLKKDDIKLEYNDKNEFTHLYTFVVRPDNTFTVSMDETEKASGSLFDNWDFQQKQIDDPTDKKPKDWVDEAKIPDPTDEKVRRQSLLRLRSCVRCSARLCSSLLPLLSSAVNVPCPMSRR
jgi:calreticulin